MIVFKGHDFFLTFVSVFSSEVGNRVDIDVVEGSKLFLEKILKFASINECQFRREIDLGDMLIICVVCPPAIEFDLLLKIVLIANLKLFSIYRPH